MKKINLLLVLALMFVFAPAVSLADQEKEDQENEAFKPTLISEEVDDQDEGETKDDQEQEREQKENSERELEMEREHASSTEDMDDEDEDTEEENRSMERKSQVANAVQEMLQVADRMGGVGEQVRIIAQEQKENYEKAEEAIMEASKRGGFTRFFVGPDYGKIKEVEKYAEQYNEKLQKMQETVAKVTAQDVVEAIDAQIKEMEQVKTDLEAEIQTQKEGFSLFGWLGRLLNK